MSIVDSSIVYTQWFPPTSNNEKPENQPSNTHPLNKCYHLNNGWTAQV